MVRPEVFVSHWKIKRSVASNELHVLIFNDHKLVGNQHFLIFINPVVNHNKIIRKKILL